VIRTGSPRQFPPPHPYPAGPDLFAQRFSQRRRLGCHCRFFKRTGPGCLFLVRQVAKFSCLVGCWTVRGKHIIFRLAALDLRHFAAGITSIRPLLANLDLNHFGSAVREALANLSGFHGLLQLELFGSRQFLLLARIIRLIGLGHIALSNPFIVHRLHWR